MKNPLILLSMVLSLVSCASVPRPDTDVGVVNAPLHQVKSYNLKSDYDDNGNLKPDAKPKYRAASTVDDLNKNICTDPQGWANLKSYIKQLRETLKARLEQNQGLGGL